MWKYIVGILLLILIIAIFYIGWFFFSFAVKKEGKELPGKGTHGTSASPWKKYTNIRKEDRKWARKLEGEDLWITSADGLKLHAVYHACPQAERTILCAHGYRGTAIGDFASVMRWLITSSNLLMIDERCCGESEGKYITFGAKEKDDICLWAEEIQKRNGELPLYLYGISLGASSVLMAAAKEKNVKLSGVIADSGYSSMRQVMGELSKKWFKIPKYPLSWIVDIYCMILGHFSMAQADTAKDLKKIKTPVLLIHGMKDDFVLPSHMEKNYEACASEKTMVKIENAWHAMGYLENTKQYQKALQTFFQKSDKQ